MVGSVALIYELMPLLISMIMVLNGPAEYQDGYDEVNLAPKCNKGRLASFTSISAPSSTSFEVFPQLNFKT
jgi:hypothetical protein